MARFNGDAEVIHLFYLVFVCFVVQIIEYRMIIIIVSTDGVTSSKLWNFLHASPYFHTHGRIKVQYVANDSLELADSLVMWKLLLGWNLGMM